MTPVSERLFLACVAASLTLSASPSVAASMATYVRLTGNTGVRDIFIMFPDGSARQVTHDGERKGLPVFSPDGKYIAYVEPRSPEIAAAELRVMDLQGKLLVSKLVEPVTPGQSYIGVRWITELQWLGNTDGKIAVTGTINPTQSVTYVVDISLAAPDEISSVNNTARVEDNYLDDAGSLSFSSNGSHVASVVGMPHFDLHLARDLVPKLLLDDKELKVSSSPFMFVSPLVWSPDSSHIGFIVRDSAPGFSLRLGILAAPGLKGVLKPSPTFAAIPEPPSNPLTSLWRLQWKSSDLYLLQGDLDASADKKILRKAWKFGNYGSSMPVRVRAENGFDSADETRKRLFSAYLLSKENLRVSDADILCSDASCGDLASAPRRFPHYDETVFVPTVNDQ